MLHCGPRDADVDSLSPRRFELRFGERDVRLRRQTASEPVACQLERPFVGRNPPNQQLAFAIESAEQKMSPRPAPREGSS